MFGSILSRLILAELVKVFLLSLTALTGMFLLAGLVQEATQRGLSPGQIALLIPLLIPSTLPYTIPATTLFATCVVYGRMAHDNEITVIRSAGVHILHLLKPAILLGVTSTAVTFWLYTDLIPRTQRMMRDKLVQNAEDVLYGMLKRDGSIRQGSLPYVIFVKEVQGKRLVDVIFKKRSKPMPGAPAGLGYDAVVRAREAKLRVDPAGGRILVELEGVHVVGDKETSGMVKERTESVPIPDQIFGKDAKARPSSLTWDELHVRRAEVMQEIDDNLARIRDIEGDLKTIEPGEVYERFKQELLLHTYELKERRRLLRSIDAEFQIRPSLALGCLCFVLIGCPVGIWASRADYLSTFVVCFLPTVFVYYPLVMGGTKFAKDGRFHEVPAIWAADGVLMAMGMYLVWRLTRR